MSTREAKPDPNREVVWGYLVELGKISNEELVNEIFRRVNRSSLGGSDSADLGTVLRDHVASEHRTLQQAFLREVIVPTIKRLAEQYWVKDYDLRNEGACQWADRAITANDSTPLPYV